MIGSVRQATKDDLAGARRVWEAANDARGQSRSAQRIDRVTEKLADPDATLLVAVGADDVVGMLLAEPGRGDGGEPAPGLGHVSMVFVHPGRQGVGVGGALLDALVEASAALRWSLLSLWTRRSNTRAQRCYEKAGLLPTGDTNQLPDGSVIDRWQRG